MTVLEQLGLFLKRRDQGRATQHPSERTSRVTTELRVVLGTEVGEFMLQDRLPRPGILAMP